MGSWGEYYRRNREDAERGVSTYTAVIDPAVIAVLDVLAPQVGDDGDRSPIFEFGHETAPTRIEMVALAEEIADAVRRAIEPGGERVTP